MFQLLRDTMNEGGLAAGHMRYARFALRSGLVDEAEESLRIAAAVEGTQSDAPHRMLAELARQTGDADAEIEAWRTVLWFDATDAEANARLRDLGVIPGPSLATPPRAGP
jgi:predicted TPR repeat methyltransferase